MSKSNENKIICSGYRKPLPPNHETKTYDKCKERSAKIRELNRNKLKKCIAKKKNGTPCGFKVSKKCGNLYCEKHFNQWRLHDKEDKFRLCESLNIIVLLIKTIILIDVLYN